MSTTEPAIAAMRDRVRAAASAGTHLRLRGAGTKDFYGEALEGEVLELGAHHGIVAYDPAELVITARCGTRLSQLEAALAASGQFLPFEPPAFAGDPTLGGVIAAGLSGPRRLYAGAARDFVLGARLLTADGELLRFGGEVMKNVAGFDVARLLCGSLGILGIITEVSLKVLPLPRQEETLRFKLSAADACTAFDTWAARPLPLSAAAWHEGAAWLRLSGAAPAVNAACAHLGGERVDSATARSWWESLRHCRLPLFAGAELWRLSLPGAAAALPGLPVPRLIDWGGTLRWYAGDRAPDYRAIAAAAGGSALCWRGTAAQGRFHPLSASSAALHRRLKQRFDPTGIFNTNRLVRGL
jgi:glycolate oxidase FAD binding subunit